MNAQVYRPDPAILSLGGEAGAPFYDAVRPAAFPNAILRYRNKDWADAIGLGRLSDDDWIGHFGRFRPLKDNLPEPLALRYHGHQFRTYNPDLGDGRGFLFAQLRDGTGRLLDLGTKGSGKTPYSRTADGRLTLKGGVREVLATQMLEALGVYTSKTFSVIETGEDLVRHDEPSPTRSCVLVRLSHSHIRFGTFQRLAFEENAQALALLVEYCVRQFEPELAMLEPQEQAEALFARIVRRTARLAAQWMAAGFVHGVLNTDNMNVTGESFDYGPWRFAPVADPAFTAAYFDQTGLYAYGRQSEAAAWNLSRLGGALLPLAREEALNAGLAGFPAAFEEGLADAFFARLGLVRTGSPEDAALAVYFLQWLATSRAPFERPFFDWFCADVARADDSPLKNLYVAPDFAPLRERLRSAKPERPERLGHPYFARKGPVTMLIDEVEALWAPIAEKDDWSRLHAKLGAIAQMREALDFDASRYFDAARF